MAKALFGLLLTCFFLEAMIASFKEEEPCSLDVAVLIDVSKSMDSEERDQLTDIFNKIVDKLGVSPTGSHMALITFGSDAKSSFTFADRNYHNADTIKAKAAEAISDLQKQDGTRTDLAEDLAVKDVFTSRGGDRPSFGNVMIILTDGKFWINETWDKRAEVDFNVTTGILKRRGVKIIVAGIGDELSSDDADENLEKVAGEDGEISKYANFTELSSKLNDIMRKVCRCPVDLAFVFDSSGTIGKGALDDAKMLVKKMVKGLKLGADESRVALVVFADKVEVKARFSENLSVKQFQDMVQNMESVGSIGRRTRIDKALVETKQVFKEGRDDVYKIAVVLTDGIQSEGRDTKSLLSTSEPLRRAGVRVIAVAIGTQASKGRLRLMTDSMDDVKEEDEALEYFQQLFDKPNQNLCVPSPSKPPFPEPEVCSDSVSCGQHSKTVPPFCETDYAAENCPKFCDLCNRLGMTV
ncbi:cartilage matrix protein-like [Pocillopora verrucosa]|uniref:cartilage matrix protein-like n=1 Tax=Pocillopora verrucosa TaxID=203993 RepID=UPI00333F4215